MCSFWAFLRRNAVVPRILCAVACREDTMMVLTFSAFDGALLETGLECTDYRLCCGGLILQCI